MGMFDSAPVKNPAPKKKGKEMEEVCVAGWCAFSAGRAVAKALEGYLKPLEAKFKEQCIKIAIDLSKGKGNKKPDTFNVLDGVGSGQFTLRKKGSNIPLDPGSITKLTAFGIPLKSEEIRPELFFINPALLANPAKRAAIEAALLAAPALAGDTIICRQEAAFKTIVADASIEKAMGLENPLEVGLCLSMLTIPAAKTGFNGTPAEAMAFMEADGFSFGEEEEEEVSAA